MSAHYILNSCINSRTVRQSVSQSVSRPHIHEQMYKWILSYTPNNLRLPSFPHETDQQPDKELNSVCGRGTRGRRPHTHAGRHRGTLTKTREERLEAGHQALYSVHLRMQWKFIFFSFSFCMKTRVATELSPIPPASISVPLLERKRLPFSVCVEIKC